mmetsp:Transcript_18897/g.28050  ORF Transcript_18897/g.28050 Transcript_18897/m.28050 type:complete len:1578 (-) Transcript_18897:181-4914(-)
MKTRSSDQDNEAEEIGYLILPSFQATTRIHRQNEKENKNNSTNSKEQARQQQQEQQQRLHEWRHTEIEAMKLQSAAAGSSSNNNNTASKDCTKCHVQLHYCNGNNNTIALQCEAFSGNTSDMICNECSSNDDKSTTKQKQKRQRQRSDASLIFGAIHACEQDDSSSLQSTVHIRQLISNYHNNNQQQQAPHHQAIIVISIPRTNERASKKRPRSTVPANQQNQQTKNSAAFQFIMAMVQSDWSKLDQFWNSRGSFGDWSSSFHSNPNDHDSNDDSNKKKSTNTTLFPSKLSLEELYCRIGSTSTSSNHTTPTSNKGEATQHVLLQDLPAELHHNIATYLRAKSLYALRCTHPILYHSLLGTVPGLQSLRLYRHQRTSLHWMHHREQQAANIAAAASSPRSCAVHNSATAECWKILSNRHGTKRYWYDALRGYICSMDNDNINSENNYSVSIPRGGLLCDDPGLGKTITVLSLILQTWGKCHDNDNNDNDPNTAIATTKNMDEAIFTAYWKETPAFSRRQELMKLTNQLRRADRAQFFERAVDPTTHDCPDYHTIIQEPMCMSEIAQRVAEDDAAYYGSDFRAFGRDVELCYRNAMTYNPADHRIHQAAQRLLHTFWNLRDEFVEKQLMRAQKAHSNSNVSGDGVGSVAALMDLKRKRQVTDALIPSMATLLVVPHTLLDHWVDQIRMYVNFNYCTNKTPIVYHYPPKKLSKRVRQRMARGDSNATVIMDERTLTPHQIQERIMAGTHTPMIFFDHGGSSKAPLPDPAFLAQFRIVVTSSNRLTSEWKHGSVEEELRRRRNRNNKTKRSTNHNNDNDDDCYFQEQSSSSSSSSLVKIHWYRMVVDEGHSMGRSTTTNAIQVASWIHARNRWAMTGTPTPQTAQTNGLRNMLGLLQFLQHDVFDARKGNNNNKLWQNCIHRGWNEGDLAAFVRLKSLLSLFMVRHTKANIHELTAMKPAYHTTRTRMSSSEILAYNTLAFAIRSNILITSMKGSKTSGWQDSLLNPRQLVHARQALQNIRLSCCGGTQIVPTLTQEYWEQTIGYLKMIHKVDDVGIQVVNNFLLRATSYSDHLPHSIEQGDDEDEEVKGDDSPLTATATHNNNVNHNNTSGCHVCGIQLQVLLLTPCAHLICTECMQPEAVDASCCPVCDAVYDVDDFQRLQPGFVFEWKWNVEEANKKRQMSVNLRRELSVNGQRQPREAAARRVPPPQHLDHQLPVPVPEAAAAAPVVIVENNANNRNIQQGGHVCTFPHQFIDGKCLVCRKEHMDCDLLSCNKCVVCHRPAENCPEEESKATYLITKLLHLQKLKESSTAMAMSIPNDAASRACPGLVAENYAGGLQCDLLENTNRLRPLKVIIFSQFRQIINVVGDRLIRRFGAGCVAEYWGSHRSRELLKFQHHARCFVMLLGKDGSHGLDLSFVTHIFFMDEIWDKSLESQVVSRAYRMGAKGGVVVEKLVAEGSVEEVMERLTQGDDDDNKTSDIDSPLSAVNGIHGDDDGGAGSDSEAVQSSSSSLMKHPGQIHRQVKKRKIGATKEVKDSQQAKLHFLLKSLKLFQSKPIRDVHRGRRKVGRSNEQWAVR